jgi:hypothetical protein
MYRVSDNIMTLWLEIVWKKKTIFAEPSVQWIITLNWIEK